MVKIERRDEPVIPEGVTVLERRIENGQKITVFKTDKGATVRMFEPIHTPEEEAEIWEGFMEAAVKLVYPNADVKNAAITMYC